MPEAGRRAPRYPRRLPVTVGVFEERASCHTTNVSRLGAHLDRDLGVSPGSLVWLHIGLPGAGEVEVTAVARPSRADDPPGTGVEFSMFFRRSRQAWEDYIHSLEWGAPQPPETEERRRWPREEVSIVLRAGGDAVEVVNISAGGARVRSARPLEVGTRVEVELLGEGDLPALILKARVLRSQDGEVALEFLDLRDEERKAVQARIREGR